MSRIVLASIAATGHVYPLLGVARTLVERGEEVLFLIPEHYREIARASGATVLTYPTTILPTGAPRRLNGFRMGHIPANLAREVLTAFPVLFEHLQRLRPAGVIHDSLTVAARLAAEAADIPTIRMNFSYCLGPHLNYYRDTEEGWIPGQLTTPETLAQFDSQLEPFFARQRLRPRTFHELVSEPAPLDLVPLSRTFHPHADRYPDHVHFVGPTLRADARPKIPMPELAVSRSQPLLLVSLGSVFTFQAAFFSTCIEALADLDAHVVLVVGDTLPEVLWADLSPNISVYRVVPQPELLARAEVFITHGGMGSVMEALLAGVPMLVVPQFPEQWLTGQRITELRAGWMLEREDVSVRTLRNALVSVRDNPSFRAQAVRLGEELRQCGGAARAADLIQGFLAGQEVSR
jgi:MGT family glycosyltransferase